MRRWALPICLILAATAGRAQAGQAMAAIPVTVEILPNCTLSIAPLTLVGTRESRPRTATDIAIACGPEQDFTLEFDRGQHAQGAFRRAFDPIAGRFAEYQIYRDSARRDPWNDGSGGASSGRTGPDGKAVLQAYAVLRQGQDLMPGRYQDQIIATINF